MIKPTTVDVGKEVAIESEQEVAIESEQNERTTSASRLQEELKEIIQHVSLGLKSAEAQPQKDILLAYAEVLKAVAEVEKVLPTSSKQTITFRLTRQELWVLFTYGAGGLLLLLALTFILPKLDWKAENLLTIFMYWSTIVAVLLGAQVLPKIFGKAE